MKGAAVYGGRRGIESGEGEGGGDGLPGEDRQADRAGDGITCGAGAASSAVRGGRGILLGGCGVFRAAAGPGVPGAFGAAAGAGFRSAGGRRREGCGRHRGDRPGDRPRRVGRDQRVENQEREGRPSIPDKGSEKSAHGVTETGAQLPCPAFPRQRAVPGVTIGDPVTER